MRKLLLVLIVWIPTLSFSQDELKGQWLRIEDRIQNPDAWVGENYDSTIVKVKEVDGNLIGIMQKVPKNAVNHGYSVGQIKWRNIKRIDNNNFELEGLLMDYGTFGNFDNPVYIKVYFQLVDNNTIILRTDEQSGRFGGTNQKWIRIPFV